MKLIVPKKEIIYRGSSCQTEKKMKSQPLLALLDRGMEGLGGGEIEVIEREKCWSRLSPSVRGDERGVKMLDGLVVYLAGKDVSSDVLVNV